MPTFTLSQKKAHDSQRHISITANAGSGKTSVLVSRYCDLVQYGGMRPRSIAAITFTEKAASELRSRIAREFELRLSDETHSGYWDWLKRAREMFPSAVVTTIHGFCSQLLREFPIETGVAANFAVISGYERSELEEAALMEAIELALSDDPPPEFDDAYDTVRRVGRERMETILRHMLLNREGVLLSRMNGALSLEDDSLLERWDLRVEAAVRSLTLNASTRPALETLIGYLKEEPRERASALLAEIESATDLSEYLVGFNTLLREILLTGSGTPRKRSYELSGDEYAVLDSPASLLRDALSAASDLIAADTEPEVHAMLLHDTHVFLNIFDKALELYDARKERIGGLDFDDLQLRLFAALEDEEVRGDIVGRFDYIMVDEFQDTNELQYRIVRSMVRDFTDREVLCVVGDRKQSIYGFRGAEVEVFSTASKEIFEINREKGRADLPFEYKGEIIGEGTRDEALGEIRLDASFRLLPGICAYVNASCAPIMRPAGSAGFGVEYEPLVCARVSDGTGTVETILARPAEEREEEREIDDDGTSSDSPEEAELIARRILQMVRDEEVLVWDRPAGSDVEEARAVRFSDIAILCRKRSTFTDLERTLRAHGIPFMTHGSSGYFRTQEIYDIVNYLRALLNSRDDVALLGLLRSPFFAVSDTELYRMSLGPNKPGDANHLWARCERRSDSGEASAALARAVEMIRDDRAIGSRIPVSLLLKRIVERTGWRGAVVGAERGEQMLANIDKLIDMARAFESRGFTNLFDFVEQVTAQIDAEDMQSEAAVNSSREAVRLMTMHAAKGLEFPVVFLPSLHAPTRASTPPFFDRDLGFGWNWKFNGISYNPMVTALMKLQRRRKEQAEEARLFYVAVTRARDVLVLSGTLREEPTAHTMLDWALQPLPQLPDDNGSVQFTQSSLGFLDSDGERVSNREWRQNVQVLRDIPEEERYDVSEEGPVTFPSDLLALGELKAHARGEIYSASQFLTYSQCTTKYYLRYRLGIPEELGSAWDLDPDSSDSEDGTRFARFFRDAASSIDRMIEAAQNGSEEREKTILRIVDSLIILEPMEAEEATGLRGRLLEAFTSLLENPIAMRAIAPDGSRSETAKELRYPFRTAGGTEYLLGVMDRLTHHADGTLSFLQYKTLKLGDRRTTQVAESYLPQLRLYALLVSKLNPNQPVVSGTILFADAPGKPQEFTFSRFDMEGIEEEVTANIEDIRLLSYTGRANLPVTSPHCPLCPYWIEETCLLAR